MRKIIFTLFGSLFLAPSLFALSPQQPATLWDHLVEVNAQWKNQVPTDFGAGEARFLNDTERIRTHLLLVESLLRTRSTAHLNTAQAERRQDMLDQLHRYAEARTFPQNHSLSRRTPFFIDQYGTACAVGHLLIESGNEEFAQKILHDDNHAYIKEMAYPELPEWAENHGFTLDELAWIQPGYPLTDPVIRLGNVTPNGPITFFKYDFTENRILIGGDFTEVSGIACNGVAAWDGSTITAFGGGIDGKIHDMVNHQGSELVAVGNFQNDGGSNVAIFRNGQWEFFQPAPGEVRALESFGGAIYLGGTLEANGSYQVYSSPLAGTTFTPVGTGFDGPIEDLQSNNGKMIAAGAFQNAGSTPTNYLARWTGQAWEDFGVGMDTTVYALGHAANGNLLAGGVITDSLGNYMNGLSEYDGNTWQSILGYNQSGPANVVMPASKIERIERDLGSNELLLTGALEISTWTLFGRNAAVFVDSSGMLAPVATPFGGYIEGFTLWNNGYLFGGNFTSVNATNIDYWGYRTLATGLGEALAPVLTTFPSPATGDWRVRSDHAWNSPRLVAIAADGRAVQLEIASAGNEIRVRRGSLAAGTYVLWAYDEDRIVGSMKMVLQ